MKYQHKCLDLCYGVFAKTTGHYWYMLHFSTTAYLENDNDKTNTNMFIASVLFSGKQKKL